jgi:FKBP-type peptidyl-prolyl cis-trans isomerase
MYFPRVPSLLFVSGFLLMGCSGSKKVTPKVVQAQTTLAAQAESTSTTLTDYVAESQKNMESATAMEIFAYEHGVVDLDWSFNKQFSVKKERDQFMYLPSLSSLTIETAKTLSAFEGRYLSINSVLRMDADVADVLSGFAGGELLLNGLNNAEPDVFAKIASADVYALYLNGCTALNTEQTKSLSSFSGGFLSLSGIKTLTPETAQMLSGFIGDALVLNGLSSLDTETAKELLQYRGGYLSLNGLSTLEAETATHIANYKGDTISLYGLQSVDSETAKILAQFQGYIGTSSAVMEKVAEAFLDKSNPVPEKPEALVLETVPEEAKRTESGLAYQVLQEGEGAIPNFESRVRISYVGWDRNGTRITNVALRPPVFHMNQLLPGLSEGVQMMKAGGKYRFWVPLDLAYRDSEGGEGVLVYDVSLLEIVSKSIE